METITDDDRIKTEDEWILQLQSRYESLEIMHTNTLRSNIKRENEAKVLSIESERDQQIKERLQQSILKTETLLQARNVEEVVFQGLLDKLSAITSTVLSEDNTFESITIVYNDLKSQFETCKGANKSYIGSLQMKATDEDLNWIVGIQEKYLSTIQKYNKCEKHFI